MSTCHDPSTSEDPTTLIDSPKLTCLMASSTEALVLTATEERAWLRTRRVRGRVALERRGARRGSPRAGRRPEAWGAAMEHRGAEGSVGGAWRVDG